MVGFFRATPMTYLCRFNQRNRLIEVPATSEFYSPQNGISHEHLKQLLSKAHSITGTHPERFHFQFKNFKYPKRR